MGDSDLLKKKFQDNLVSVITPVYKAEKYLRTTIDSVLAQTYPNIEMILVDDCSPDHSREIIEEYQQKTDKLVYHKQEKNMGAGVARNTALELGRGRYVAFLDSDDVWKPEKIRRQIHLMKKTDAPFCFTAIEMIDGNGKVTKPKRNVRKRVNYKVLLHNTMIPTSSVVIDRWQCGDFRMPLRRGGQDYATWLNLLRDGKVAYGINDALTQYRIDGESLSSNKLKSVKQIWEIQTQDEGINKVVAVLNIGVWAVNSVKKYFG